jgi:hypothetical protein
MNICFFSTWAVGLMNGIITPHKDATTAATATAQGLPTGFKYGTIGLVSGVGMANAIGNLTSAHLPLPRIQALGIFAGIPLLVGSVFCTGHFVGKSVRYSLTDIGKQIYESVKSIENIEIKPKGVRKIEATK